MSISPAHIAQLKEFVKVLQGNPDILHDDRLAFFRDYLTSLGATVPQKKQKTPSPKAPEPQQNDEDDMPDLEDVPVQQQQPEEPEEEEEEEEEIIEPVDPNVIEPESDAPQAMGNSSVEVSDEGREKAQELRGQAQELISGGDVAEAIKVLTDAITNHNGSSAPLFATRGQCYLRLKKPASAIRDADAAIKINPDSAAAYRVRGKAKALLGKWNEAAADLKAANQRDYDPEVNDALKAVSVKADEFNARQKKRDEQKKRKESKSKARGAGAGGFPNFGGAGGFPNFGGAGGFPDFGGAGAGGFPNFGGAGAGAGAGGAGGIPPEFLSKIMQDPEVLSVMSDPEVMPVLSEIMKDPSAAAKYKDHPKIGKLLTKFGAMFGK